MAKAEITIYGCGQDEAVLFREMAPRFDVMPRITDAAISEVNVELACRYKPSSESSAYRADEARRVDYQYRTRFTY